MDMHISQLFQPGYNSIVWPRLKDPVPTSGAYLPLRRGELCDASIHHHVQLIPVAVAGNCAAICAGKTALDSSCTFERQHLGGYLITPHLRVWWNNCRHSWCNVPGHLAVQGQLTWTEQARASSQCHIGQPVSV